MPRLTLLALMLLLASPPDRAAPDLGVPSKTGLVVCTSSPACDAGASVLARAGNAVDAAVATAFALAVTHPSAGNVGGGGFMIVRTPSGELTAIDYREKAPGAATRTMYLDADGKINRSLTNAGYLAPGVPGAVRGLQTAHTRFGKLPWKDVVMPGVLLAEQGFPVSAGLARSLNSALQRGMAKFPASVAAYGKPGGGKWAQGDRIVLADLGRTLRAIATDGPDAFYKGWIADRIADDMKANGGLITKSDLAAYEAKVRTPVRGTYREYEVISMPPPSSGGVTLIEMLNILEPLALKSKGLLTAPALHLQIEAMRRAYLDRARHLGDPDFVEVPVARLTSKDYARTVAATIGADKASRSADLGRDIVTTPQEPDETTHYSVIDRHGMAVATTTTLEGSYGSHVVVKGAGFLLNNEMGDFNPKPGATNLTGDIGTPANVIDPGKRMLSSMTPTMVVRDGKVVLITGSPGGRTIINTVLAIVLGVTEYGLTGREAVDMTRMHHQWLPDDVTIEATGVSDATIARLRSMGHRVRTQGRQGDAHSIWVSPDGTPYGINDKRTPDSKASVPAHLTAPTGGQ
ncbi:MAG: gamma-glutamyltransferase [Acidobacteria bacterium]|nr:gamma-glutamyltransferase [Acidobacteriota bacterium]MCA1648753.1 gamma-glutamyltransferase [Acidobacteriota bacterium]